MLSPGTRSAMAFFKMYFEVLPFTLKLLGNLAANSVKCQSRNGDLASSEFAIVAMSIFTSRSVGRYHSMSACSIESIASSDGADAKIASIGSFMGGRDDRNNADFSSGVNTDNQRR